MKFLFTLIPEKGHINPYIPVAQSLQNNGHDVAFFAEANISVQLERAGFSTFVGGKEAPEPPDANRGAFFADKVRDTSWLRSWVEKLLLDSIHDKVPVYQHLIHTHKPDIVIVDPMVYPAVIAAHLAGIPWISVSNSLNPVLNSSIQSDLLDTVSAMHSRRADIFAQYGLENVQFRGCDTLSPYLTICFATKEFVGEKDGVSLVGPSLPQHKRGDETYFPWERLHPTKKKIYVSFGSQIYHQPLRFNRLIQALDDGMHQLILSVGPLLGSASLQELPQDAIAVSYTPQLALLPHVDLFVTHGGANSVMEALSVGVPILIDPICNDQVHQAHFITQAGVGKVLLLEQVSPEEIRATLEYMLASQSLEERVQEIQESYRVNGAEIAAQEIINKGEVWGF